MDPFGSPVDDRVALANAVLSHLLPGTFVELKSFRGRPLFYFRLSRSIATPSIPRAMVESRDAKLSIRGHEWAFGPIALAMLTQLFRHVLDVPREPSSWWHIQLDGLPDVDADAVLALLESSTYQDMVFNATGEVLREYLADSDRMLSDAEIDAI